ncbi:MAG: primosomal protein N' [Chromatiales bacterium]|nr:primosomal protein N' [Chromatiales bacterium]
MPIPVILQVAIPAPLYQLFDYLPPKHVDPASVQVGARVLVPFGRGRSCGVVMGITDRSDFDRSKLKRASEVLDTEPLLPVDSLAFLSWAAAYYQHPIGEVVSYALPVRLRKGEIPLSLCQPGWCLSADGESIDLDQLKRAPKQRSLLQFFRDQPGCRSKDEVYRECGEGRSALKALIDKGWLRPCEVAPRPMEECCYEAVVGPELNDDQQSAVDAVAAGTDQFGVFLLDGVTGSGKTEVYLTLIEQVLAAGRQVLVLVPEIGLTPQLLRRFTKRISTTIALLHSGLSDRERELAWHAARSGQAPLVLGTRSALFTPLQNLGLIVVDEEHDLSFKQQDGFRFSARDLAVVRAQRAECPVMLGSATPSLESLGNGIKGRYRRLPLKQRAGGAKPPKIDLLDIRSVRLDAGVSPTLMRLIEDELAKQNQVLLFLNRRGYAPVITCHDCGWISLCRRCDARMTLHRASNLLWCHHCGSQRRVDPVCPECGQDDLRPLGQGTERVEEMFSQRLPDTALARIDRDATRRKGSLEKLLADIDAGKYSLLLGTQMLAKGHHFPHVTLVAILDVDLGLFGADYRAAERMAQLIVQVAGRAGRAEKPGRVLIQTRHPDHPLLQTLIHEGYGAFAQQALQERREVGYPPYSYHALLRAEATKEEEPRRFLDQVVELVNTQLAADVELWGPVPAPMERRAGRYRAHLLLQAVERSQLHRLLSQLLPKLQKLPAARRVRWSLDVDPQEMY